MNKTGFGFLRLPRLDPEDEKSIDLPALCSLVDRFLEKGGSYFDTAYTYLGGASEEALKKTLVDRYPREQFRIADKLPGFAAKSKEDNLRFFEESRNRCGVDYFDVYLLHGLNAENYEIAEQLEQFAFLQSLKEQGRVKKTGFSYHDTAELLDRILTDHPEVDYVQLQINYLDWDSQSVQSRECYETVVRHHKPVLVMEPVKGGTLANLPAEAERQLKQMHPGDSAARWAIRFATDLAGVAVVLSGMNSPEQIEDNMAAFPALSAEELAALRRSAEIIRDNTAIQCTGCGYCTDGCPVGIPIPQYFSLYNEYKRHPGELWKTQIIYTSMSKAKVPASACIRCGQCESHCPQKLSVTDWLCEVDSSLREA